MEQKSSPKIGFVASAIYMIAFLLILVGAFFVIKGIIVGEFEVIAIGLACLANCPLVWGYGYIVEAACKYLEK